MPLAAWAASGAAPAHWTAWGAPPTVAACMLDVASVKPTTLPGFFSATLFVPHFPPISVLLPARVVLALRRPPAALLPHTVPPTSAHVFV